MLESVCHLIDYLKSLPWDSWQIITLLIAAGFCVGFINTLAGSGSVLTYALFTLLGLPLHQANGTIRFGVVLQTLGASYRFWRNNLLEVKTGLKLGIPTVIGSLAGAQLAIEIDAGAFRWVLIGALLLILVILFFKPKTPKHLEGLKTWQKDACRITLFFLLGVYGGLIHMGVGIFLIAAIHLFADKELDLLHANAIKVFIVVLYSPFALAIYMLYGQVHYYIGAVSMIGNLIGCYVASGCAIRWGSGFIKWVLSVVIVFFVGYLMLAS